jgi:hypothetical protein
MQVCEQGKGAPFRLWKTGQQKERVDWESDDGHARHRVRRVTIAYPISHHQAFMNIGVKHD